MSRALLYIQQYSDVDLEHGLVEQMRKVKIREAVKGEVLLIHSEEHWDRIRAISG